MKQSIRKILCLVLAAMLLSLAACGKDGGEESEATDIAPQEETVGLTVAIPLELSAGSCEIEIYYDDKAFVGEFELK